MDTKMNNFSRFLNKKFSALAGIVVVLLFALLAGGFLIWQCKIVPKEIKIPEIKRPGRETEDETTDWKIYRNEEFGFEIKYPKDWKVNHDSSDTVWIATTDIANYLHGIGVPPKGDAWIDFYSSFSLPKNFSAGREEIKVLPGDDSIIIFSNEILTSRTQTIGVRKGYWKNDPLASQFDKVFNQMLSTFRFLE